MDKLKKSLENPATANIIYDALANLALISVSLSQLGFRGHVEPATAFTESIVNELEVIAKNLSESAPEALIDLLDEIENHYDDEGV